MNGSVRIALVTLFVVPETGELGIRTDYFMDSTPADAAMTRVVIAELLTQSPDVSVECVQ